jgi:DNA transformation protein and related proteins
MTVSKDYLDWLCERLEPLGPITPRRMFSGAGLFIDGAMFAIVLDDTLYWKSDALTAAQFDAADCAPFSYEKKTGTTIVTALRRCPDDAFDEDDMLLDWARLGLAAGRRAALKKAARKARVKKTAAKTSRAKKVKAKP